MKKTLAVAGVGADKRIFVVGAKRFGDIQPARYLRLPPSQRAGLRNPIEHVVANDLLATQFSTDVYVDPIKAICGGGGTCPVFTPGGRLISYDGYHLTRDGARYVGEVLFAKTALASLQSH